MIHIFCQELFHGQDPKVFFLTCPAGLQYILDRNGNINGINIASGNVSLTETDFTTSREGIPYHRRPGIGKHRPWQGGW